jgi:hypothetical protein
VEICKKNKNIERKFDAQYNEKCNVLGLNSGSEGKKGKKEKILLRKEENEETRVVLCKEI